jgi:hypothetical protein
MVLSRNNSLLFAISRLILSYARLGDSLAVGRRKLDEEHGLKIGCVNSLSNIMLPFSDNVIRATLLLKNLNTYFEIASLRKPMPRKVADQHIQ